MSSKIPHPLNILSDSRSEIHRAFAWGFSDLRRIKTVRQTEDKPLEYVRAKKASWRCFILPGRFIPVVRKTLDLNRLALLDTDRSVIGFWPLLYKSCWMRHGGKITSGWQK